MTPLIRLIRLLIDYALEEDIGAGDLTTRALLGPRQWIRAIILAKSPGIVAGVPIVQTVFSRLDRRIRSAAKRADGQTVAAGQIILSLEGPVRSILTAERTALNFLGHLSGIATLTRQFVDQVRPYPVKILDTRKTTPVLRLLEKYAVKMGGGTPHRLGLDDAILIKTNHVKAASNQPSAISNVIQTAIKKARQRTKEKTIEVEVTNFREFLAALEARPDIIMLDNWRIPHIRKAVALRKHSTLLEVSGGVTLQNVRAIAKTGIDRIAIGALTHSAPALDVSLRVVSAF